jgi:hypothetical protein
MRSRSLARRLSRIVRHRWPSAIVVVDPTDRSPFWPPHVHVHCLPRPRLGEFMDYSIHDLPGLAEREGLPDFLLFSHPEDQTRRHYPGVCPHRERRYRRPGRRAGSAASARRR